MDISKPIRTTPFAPWPYFGDEEIQAVEKVLRSGKVNYWTGQEARLFEKEFAAFVGVPYAVALANGTLALELALHVLEIKPGDEVVVTSRTFIASASCAVLLGARPIFADIDRVSQNITADTISKVITPRTKAIIAVHLAGWPCEMDRILDLAESRQIKVIEDCAQAQGALYQNKPVGSWGHIAAFSFCQDKIFTTGGEGGMLTTNSTEWWDKAWSYKDHGKSYAAVYQRQHGPGFRWVHESFGTNWRITEIQAAIGRIGLKKMPQWLAIRRKHAQILTQGFSTIPGLRVTIPPAHILHAYYKYYTFVEPTKLRSDWNRDRIMTTIVSQGIPCAVGSCSEVYQELAFIHAGLQPQQRLPVAQELGATALVFLVHPTLQEQDMHDTVDVVRSVMLQAVK